MPDLSILIPARNEQFLARTIEDILQNIRGDTEIIAVLDGQWADPPIPDYPDQPVVTLIYHPESIGQRAATNEAAKLSQSKYIMKCDAHCAFDEGFDVKMLDEMQDNWTMVPVMKNLHAFDWVCPVCNNRMYQGPKPEICPQCQRFREHERDIVWRAKPSPNSTAYRFTRELQFKYFPELKKRQKGDIVETMSLQGSCFMATQDKYWELELCDESWGSWGQQGTEVAIKTWLSGGRVVCNRKTWYAHMFRTRKGFNWPYPAPGKSQRKARKISQDIFLNDKWDKAIHPLSWLIDKFAPVPDWEEQKPTKDLTKGIVYYTDNRLDEKILLACQKQLEKAVDGKQIVNISLQPMDFADNIVLPLERGYLTMFKQILRGLEVMETDIVFFCEHDILYHPSHFDFTPEKDDIYYYNENVWKFRASDGHALFYYVKQTSGLCANRELLLQHYRKRVEFVEKNGYNNRIGFEPGTHGRAERLDDYMANGWMSEFPNIDIRHKDNLTPSRWNKKESHNQEFTRGWKESNEIPGWGIIKDMLDKIMR